MNRKTIATLVFALSSLDDMALAASKTIEMPSDGMQLKPSNLPGYAIAKTRCLVCHSAEYMLYQPPDASRIYWEATVKRMKQVFNAPINDTDMPAIVDYLDKTYGSERSK